MKRGRLFILLIEDEEHDAFFVRQATEQGTAGHILHAVRDGREAISYLKGKGQYADRQNFPLPNVILTDLKMPGMNGFDFLRWMRDNPDYWIIPIIVYSNSRLEADVRRAYRLGANAYFTKPNQLADLVEMLRLTYEYWSRCECPAAR